MPPDGGVDLRRHRGQRGATLDRAEGQVWPPHRSYTAGWVEPAPLWAPRLVFHHRKGRDGRCILGAEVNSDCMPPNGRLLIG